ncbi:MULTISPECIES: hypothetical protein [unclassified Staphylococcus]|uniref:hypothetical protein n=1 Tax=unclassified Staphylococcus TaxID=91994 RepID=UPI0021D37135|nr:MULTISPECIES: hypothetical protein [unclassified Staphylococcus]UXR70025.1 hypothetical protein MUA26_02450 [Staphylococcus sp. IVB6246]UXR74373.1 hypothetical protein MUA48_02610 [Staphylococcus sp. IVB6238]UXR76760.1 hypothetical protein MUA74_02970 [Staphylococcus sp. IVB6233]UXR80890.1 hypothetical protein MUA65_02585 [Staphylococcus sp. IVB6218]
MSQHTDTEVRANHTGKLLAYVSFLFAVCLTIHQVVIVDGQVIGHMLEQSGNNVSKNAINTISNSLRYTGILYILAYSAGVVAIKFQHPYLWWFMVAVFVSQVFNALLNPPILYSAIFHVKGFFALVPYGIVVLGSIAVAAFMITTSVKRKTTFNR